MDEQNPTHAELMRRIEDIGQTLYKGHEKLSQQLTSAQSQLLENTVVLRYMKDKVAQTDDRLKLVEVSVQDSRAVSRFLRWTIATSIAAAGVAIAGFKVFKE